MMDLLKRSLNLDDLPTDVEEDQVTGFLGGGVAQDAQIWSKAGWTSQVRHDAAYIELPEQRPYILVVFTEGKANAKNRDILPFVSRLFAKAMSSL
jgi:beta-lactamase class A